MCFRIGLGIFATARSIRSKLGDRIMNWQSSTPPHSTNRVVKPAINRSIEAMLVSRMSAINNRIGLT